MIFESLFPTATNLPFAYCMSCQFDVTGKFLVVQVVPSVDVKAVLPDSGRITNTPLPYSINLFCPDIVVPALHDPPLFVLIVVSVALPLEIAIH